MKLRHSVFWPPFLLLLAAPLVSWLDNKSFTAWNERANAWILDHFGNAFGIAALMILLTCVLAYVSPLGRVRLGGDRGKRLLKPYDWFAVSLCVNTAVGILFWATAEPLVHLASPPKSLGLVAGSPGAQSFAMSTLFLHWSFTPSALYTLPALAFALAFYNMKQPYSLLSCLYPLTGGRGKTWLGPVVDGIALFSLVTGMAASLGTGVLTLAGGFQHAYGIESSWPAWIAIGGAVVAAFLLSSISGLDRGIRWLSWLNAKVFFVFLALAIVFGPWGFWLELLPRSFAEFVTNFWGRSTFTAFAANDPWPRAWTIFYWAIWLAWAPITAVFLGRIGVGYTVRQFILVNLVAPAVFAIVWMGIFGGTALSLEASGVGLSALMKAKGPESLIYGVLARYPGSVVWLPLFLITVFISYVTSADSNTTVMAGISSVGIEPESPEPGVRLKVVWGSTLGLISLVMLCHSGIDGIRTLSYLGGLPALIFEVAVMAGLWAVCLAPHRFLLPSSPDTPRKRSLAIRGVSA